MSSLNKAQLIGRLGQDPELRSTQGGTNVATLSVATSQKYKDKQGQQQESTEWHKCVAWGKTADLVAKYLSKGSLVFVEGPLETRKWEDKEGVERYTTQIKVLNVVFLDSKADKSEPANNVPVNMDEIDSSLPF